MAHLVGFFTQHAQTTRGSTTLATTPGTTISDTRRHLSSSTVQIKPFPTPSTTPPTIARPESALRGKTPVLDALAAESVRLKEYYAHPVW